MTHRRLSRRLHPGAWWLWVIGLAAAASLTTNPFLLLLVMAVAALVAVARQPPSAPWARAFRFYAWLALIVVCLRVGFRVLLGDGLVGNVLFSLPTLPLPEWLGGITVGGPVTAESLVAALYDGARLAAIVICVGAVNTVADPRRMLRSLPRALYDIGTAAVVGLSLAPQLIESVGRVRRARQLRGDGRRGIAAIRPLLVPVLEDALHRSLALAAAMDSRGYGRLGAVAPSRRFGTGALVIGGLLAVCVGMYGLLDGRSSGWGAAILATGLAVATLGLVSGGRLVDRSVYRPERWAAEEWLVACSGLVAAAGVIATGWLSPLAVAPAVQPLSWPEFSPLASVAILAAGLPAFAAPPLRTHVSPTVSPSEVMP